ncbi:PREDICTED: junctophilin-1 isoform X1 [Nicrophorus vespilloides]|uniref:Junctophilin-1 isoform X1 n=1 Tax=Nicrophorus vespilloides TaxID=110193 RepID=A0ABM1ND38_NICVS|nr:PREDICTED: junctophilin-1 isoform X1 [Nicrophorus vespilloides]
MQQGTEDGGSSPAATGATGTATTNKSHVNGGRFDFDDGGTYCGGWEEGKAHGHGVCTGPKGQGAYSGSWHYGFEVSGVYTWPSGSAFEGQWQNGKRHGLGVESRGRWIYRGEWTQGFKGRYGVRQSNTSTAKYEGTWANGLQDGYGSETYADDGTYQGQWMRGMRHGYGVRNSAPFGKASKYRTSKAIRASMTSLRSNEAGGAGPEPSDKRDKRVDDSRGGFVLKMNSNEPAVRRRSLGSSNIKRGLFSNLLKKQRSTGDLEKRITGSIRSTASSASWVSTDSAQSAMTNASVPSDSNASFVVEDEQMDPSVKETYMGEWKNDKRTGYGVSERSDGLKYEGEWFNNKKYGYGVTTFSNGEKEEGKYKNNVLITNPKKKHIFLMRSAKFRERIEGAVNAAQRASKIAMQKADIAISRTATARGKAEASDKAAACAREDSNIAQTVAKKYAPDFKQPGLERLRAKEMKMREKYGDYNAIIQKDTLQNNPTNEIPNQIPNEIPLNQNLLSNQMPKKPMFNNTTNQTEAYHNNPTTSLPNNNIEIKKDHLNEMNHQLLSKQFQKEATPIRGRQSISSIDHSQPGALPRASRRISGDRPYLGTTSQQSSIDHFDHYKRPPSRDSSVDRYSRATGRMGGGMGSRQPSVDRTARPSVTPDRTARAPSAIRGTTPAPPAMRNGSVVSAKLPQMEGNGSAVPQQPPFEEILIKKKNLGQDIIPSPNQPKRTESLFIAGGNATAVAATAAAPKNVIPQTSLSRKKSLPDFQELPRATGPMSREEVSALGSARREEVRRQADEKEKLRANPLLYLVSPQVKDWFSRQQLVIVILFVNISLAIMFFKMLT